MVISSSAVGQGTYYATFYDPNNACFGLTSREITVSKLNKKRRNGIYWSTLRVVYKNKTDVKWQENTT
jgi:hypothetical protein